MMRDILSVPVFRWAAIGIVALVLVLALTAGANAQTLTFTAETVTGAGSVVPKLTWSTSPAATSCTASGDAAWTGSKPVSGTETLAAITASKSYSMLCTWPDASATLTWTPPTLNTDDTPLTNLAGYRIKNGATATTMTNNTDVPNPAASSYTMTGLPAGPRYFAVLAYTTQGTESVLSNTVNKTISATQTATRNVTITVNPQPKAPTTLTVQ